MGARLCAACRERPALFRVMRGRNRGRVKADTDHDLCFRCYRQEHERQRQRQKFWREMDGTPWPPPA